MKMMSSISLFATLMFAGMATVVHGAETNSTAPGAAVSTPAAAPPPAANVTSPAPAAAAGTGFPELKLPDAGSPPAVPALPDLHAPAANATAAPAPAADNLTITDLPKDAQVPPLPANTGDGKAEPLPLAPLPQLPQSDSQPLAGSVKTDTATPPPPAMVKPVSDKQELSAPARSSGRVKKTSRRTTAHHRKTGPSAKDVGGNKAALHERLPDTIYKKRYDGLNKHLPTAYYEKDYDNLVFVTAAHDDLNGLRAVLATGRSVNLVNAQGDTPLLAAVKANAINTARLLVARHADVDRVDANGMTALAIATRNGNYALQRALEMGVYAPQHDAGAGF